MSDFLIPPTVTIATSNIGERLSQQAEGLFQNVDHLVQLGSEQEKDQFYRAMGEMDEKSAHAFNQFIQIYRNQNSSLLILNQKSTSISTELGQSNPLAYLAKILTSQKNIQYSLNQDNWPIAEIELYRNQNLFSRFQQSLFAKDSKSTLVEIFHRLRTIHLDQFKQYQLLKEKSELEAQQLQQRVSKTIVQTGAAVATVVGIISSAPVSVPTLTAFGLGATAYYTYGVFYDSAQSILENAFQIYQDPTLSIRQKTVEIALDALWTSLEIWAIKKTAIFYENVAVAWSKEFGLETLKTTVTSFLGVTGIVVGAEILRQKVEATSDGFIHEGLGYFNHLSLESAQKSIKDSVSQAIHQFPQALYGTFLAFATFGQVLSIFRERAHAASQASSPSKPKSLVPLQNQLQTWQNASGQQPPWSKLRQLIPASQALTPAASSPQESPASPKVKPSDSNEIRQLLEQHLEKTLLLAGLHNSAGSDKSYQHVKDTLKRRAEFWIHQKQALYGKNSEKVAILFKEYSSKIQYLLSEVIQLHDQLYSVNSSNIDYLCTLATSIDTLKQTERLWNEIKKNYKVYEGIIEPIAQVQIISIGSTFWKKLNGPDNLEELLERSKMIVLRYQAVNCVGQSFQNPQIAIVALTRLQYFFDDFPKEVLADFSETWPLVAAKMKQIAKKMSNQKGTSVNDELIDLLSYLKQSRQEWLHIGEKVSSIQDVFYLLSQYDNPEFNQLVDQFIANYSIPAPSSLHDKVVMLLKQAPIPERRSNFSRLSKAIDQHLERQKIIAVDQRLSAADLFDATMPELYFPGNYNEICQAIEKFPVQSRRNLRKEALTSSFKSWVPLEWLAEILNQSEFNFLLETQDQKLRISDYRLKLQQLTNQIIQIINRKAAKEGIYNIEENPKYYVKEFFSTFRKYIISENKPKTIDELIARIARDARFPFQIVE